MRNRRPSILVTGFGPFPSVPVNATVRLVAEIGAAAPARFPNHRFVTEVLPTEWHAAPRRLSALLTEHVPSAAVHFGVSQSVTGFAVERLGHNACRLALDAAGALPAADVLHIDGPAHRETLLPVAAIVSRLTALRLPVSISEDAGRYLCNSVLYHSLAQAEAGKVAVAGFVHIPAAIGNHPGAALSWADAVLGALEIISATVDAAAAHASEHALTGR